MTGVQCPCLAALTLAVSLKGFTVGLAVLAGIIGMAGTPFIPLLTAKNRGPRISTDSPGTEV